MADLEPTDARNHEIKDDESDLESDWYEYIGQPLFNVDQIEDTGKPNRVPPDWARPIYVGLLQTMRIFSGG